MSFLLEGEGGATERGRVGRWKNTRYSEAGEEEESETERKREDGRHRGGEESWTEEVGLEARQMREADVHHVRI